jgi:DNA (cytosine-5)-methyltransferase 1
VNDLIVDLFAGGGGASEGIRMALGRDPDIAVNHDDEAIAVHTRNHPGTLHHCASVWNVKPLDATGGRPVGLLWASPDCRHFSRAAGGRPKWKSVRSLPGVVLTWAKQARPRVIVVENVREFLGWGPLLDDGTPCPARIGRSFNIWVGRLRGLGYQVQWRELCAADFGAPTIRTRLFVVARCDGQPIVWPQPTHSKRPSLIERPWRTASECIDWSLPCPSIFTRTRPLAAATLRRVAEGVRRFVLGKAEPFVVTIDHQSSTSAVAPQRAPLSTITSKARHAIVAPTLVEIGYGEAPGQAPRAPGLGKPLGTAVAGGCKHAVVAAFLAQHNGGATGYPASQPLSTTTTRGTQQAAVMARLSAGDEAGAHRVAAFLMQYYGSGGQHADLRAPLGAVTTHDRFALVTVAGTALPIVDIGMRMLAPDELKAAQGFPAAYDMTDGGRLTKTTQVRLIGNSVSPPVATAVVRRLFNLHFLAEAA